MKTYSLEDIIISSCNNHSIYIGTFQETEDPDIEWPHRHDFYSLVWFTEGYGINVIDFKEYQIRPNRLFLVKPNQVHNWSYSEDTKGHIIVCEQHMIDHAFLSLFCQSYIDIFPSEERFLLNTFTTLLSDDSLEDDMREKLINIGINYLFAHIHRNHKPPKLLEKESQIILQFSELIYQNISENIPIKTLVEKLKITNDQLSLICQNRLGKSTKSHILELKITEAKRLLYFSQRSIKEISYQLGFEDNSYFARIFKQKVGVSPKQFRNKSTINT
ncbi:AraC family transcriptional regulator [Halosquirtibacter laminarini]|uniref:AraC family transcriptional regulator n=1 Tax=Halosquirtibacter laminarini TaxID=3374600 RepID=A0AC61NCJ3_9BACT|nr:AraC family transcriptional regulator [Prolixibacteraceae bacterium]